VQSHARRLIEAWRVEYNTERPRSSLGNRMPQEFATDRTKKEEYDTILAAGSNAISG
jgi:putative transposase